MRAPDKAKPPTLKFYPLVDKANTWAVLIGITQVGTLTESVETGRPLYTAHLEYTLQNAKIMFDGCPKPERRAAVADALEHAARAWAASMAATKVYAETIKAAMTGRKAIIYA